eukprot:scaffold1492_cov257-Pinguiococcus_pyrenoidosus.AAC.11
MTVLHVVCQEGYLPMLTFLLSPGNRSIFDKTEIEVDKQDERGRTALLRVLSAPHDTFCGRTFGVDAETGNARSEEPLAIELDSDWIRPGESALPRRSVFVEKRVSSASAPGGQAQREAMVQILLRNGADANYVDFHGYTPLLLTAAWGWLKAMVSLVEAGADLEHRCETGQSALHFACEYGREEVRFILPTVFW